VNLKYTKAGAIIRKRSRELRKDMKSMYPEAETVVYRTAKSFRNENDMHKYICGRKGSFKRLKS